MNLSDTLALFENVDDICATDTALTVGELWTLNRAVEFIDSCFGYGLDDDIHDTYTRYLECIEYRIQKSLRHLRCSRMRVVA